jgi:hypothetical protein
LPGAEAPEAAKPKYLPAAIAVYAHRKLLLDGFEVPEDSDLKSKPGTNSIILHPEPVLFPTDSTASSDKNQLANEALVHLRRAARAQKDKIYISGGRNKYYRRLLLRPLLIPGTKAYANAHAIRQQFRQALARQLVPKKKQWKKRTSP